MGVLASLVAGTAHRTGKDKTESETTKYTKDMETNNLTQEQGDKAKGIIGTIIDIVVELTGGKE